MSKETGSLSVKRIKTSTLLRNLLATENLGGFLRKNNRYLSERSLSEYLSQLCAEKKLLPEHVIKRANLERSYGHQIFRGIRTPSRDKVIQLAFGFGLNYDETQKLLQYADKSPLYPKIKRDAAILYCMHHHLDIVETQIMLEQLELPTLGGV